MKGLGPVLLFCPGDRPERFRRAANVADHAILDLEDAVGPGAKGAARLAVEHSFGELPNDTIIRINAAASPWFHADLEAVRRCGAGLVMLPKVCSPDELDPLEDLAVIAICESSHGVSEARAIAAKANCVALMWGGEDLIADIGGDSSRKEDGTYRDVVRFARATTLLAAASQGKAAIDGVFLDIVDKKGLAAEAADAVASGFTSKACIHPAQVPVVRASFTPSPAAVTLATAILGAAERSRGVFVHRGRMVDGPVLAHARRVVARADGGASSPSRDAYDTHR